jgi:hypothetical protein
VVSARGRKAVNSNNRLLRGLSLIYLKNGGVIMKSGWILVCLLLLFSLSVYAQEFKITIDAEKDAFYNTLTGPDDGWVWIPYQSYNNNGTADDPGPVSNADLSVNFYSAWDDTYLYVYEEVSDDIVNVNRGENYWRNDCLDAKIDPDPTGVNNNSVFCFAMTPLDSVDVPADAVGGVANIVETVGGGWADTTNSGWPHPDDYARMLTDTGYVLELRLKWAWVATSSGGVIDKGPIYPAVGNTYGFAISQHDNDGVTTNGRDNSLEWAAVLLDAVWNTCSDMGYIELLPDHKIKYVAESLRDPTIVNPHPEWYIPTAGPSAVSQQSAVVKSFALRQNYPNPFNPSTRIEFSVPKSTFVTVKVFNLLGEEVGTLASQQFNAGRYTVDWNARSAPSGVYFYRLTAGPFVDTKRMLLLR